VQELLTPCMFCDAPVLETSLDCSECKSKLVFCIASGKHVVLDDWYECPVCEFPGIGKYLKAVVEVTGCCPMCYTEISVEGLVCKTRESLQLATNGDSMVSESATKDVNYNGSTIGGLAV
jgi:WD repeat-containing protein 19